MEANVWYIVQEVVEVLKVILFYGGVLNLKLTTVKKKYIGVGVILLVDMLVFVLNDLDMLQNTISSMARFLAIILIADTDMKTKVLAFVPVESVIEIADVCIRSASGLLFSVVPIDVSRPVVVVHYMVTLLILFIIFVGNRKKNKYVSYRGRMDVKQYLLTFFILVITDFMFSTITFLCWKSAIGNPFIKIVLIIQTVLMLFLMIVVLLYVNNLNKINQLNKGLLKCYEDGNENQKKYFQTIYQNNQELKRIQHDTRHHYRYLYELLSNEEVEGGKHYLEKIQNGLQQSIHNVVYSGNQMIDYVIYAVLGHAIENEEIKFHYKGKLKKHLSIDDAELCCLLSNGLENALEACQRTGKQGFIHLAIGYYRENILITIENSYNGELHNGKLTTSKNSEQHGFGYRNMELIVEKYNGNLFYIDKGGLFVLKIYLEEKDGL